MSLSGRLLLALLPQRERDHLLSYIPDRDRRHLEKVLKGRARYPRCFDQRQALFIHIPKTAGRSLVKALFDVNSVEHATAAWYQQIDPVRFERYFKFAVVRNPWDRLVSTWSYLHQGGSPSSEDDARWAEFIQRYDSFDDFVCQWLNEENIRRKHLFTPQYQFVLDRFGYPAMNFIGRYEQLAADFQQLRRNLGVTAELPHLNPSRRQPWQELYSPRSREIVARVYARDIEMFGYRFDQPAAAGTDSPVQPRMSSA